MTNAINAEESIGPGCTEDVAYASLQQSLVGACLEKVSVHSGKLANPALWQDLHRHSSSFQFNKADILFIP